MNCPTNCGCKQMVKRNAEDIQRIWKSIERMVGWVIASSGTVIVFVLTVFVKFLLKYSQ